MAFSNAFVLVYVWEQAVVIANLETVIILNFNKSLKILVRLILNTKYIYCKQLLMFIFVSDWG